MGGVLCAAGAVVSRWNGNETWLRVCDDGWKGRRGRVVEGLGGQKPVVCPVERYHPLTGLGDPVSGSGSIVQPPSQITVSKTTNQSILLKHKGYLRFRKSILILHRQPPLIPRSQKRHQREIHHHRQSP